MKYFPILLLIIIQFGCKSALLPPDKYQSAQISFGSGGGFSGEFHEYTLLDDGRLFKKSRDGMSFEELKSVDKKLTKQIFDNITTFGIDKYQYNQPQNLYYFLAYSAHGETNKIVWSGQPENKLAIVNSIYKLLVTQSKNSKQ